MVAGAVLVAVFVAMGVDGRVVRASVGHFSASFAGGESGMACGTHMGYFVEACFVHDGVQCLGVVAVDGGGCVVVGEAQV